jgi:sulfur-carrier protein
MSSRVTIEFFGIPRERAGLTELQVKAATVGEALYAAARHCPALHGLIHDGRIAPHYRISINGQRFVTDLDEKLAEGDRVLILSADVGG